MSVKVINFNLVPLVLQSVILENNMCYATNYSQRPTALETICDLKKNKLNLIFL